MLCDPVARAVLPSIFWTRTKLPELCPWFESRLFGRHRTNYPLETNFSVFGHHIESAQDMALKEAIVRLTLRLRQEKDARRAPEMRIPIASDAFTGRGEVGSGSSDGSSGRTGPGRRRATAGGDGGAASERPARVGALENYEPGNEPRY